ncbi:outer membrane protein [Notoacmeibacter ruber]|nr:outer membrane beta-barrel protein [Notoacmeibacter ruber]
MKKFLLLCSTALAIGAYAQVATAADVVVYEPVQETVDYVPTRNFYASIFGGVAIPHDLEFDVAGTEVDLDLHTGFVVGGTVGYRYERIRGELEVSYQRFGGDEFSFGGIETDLDGDAYAVYILGNLWADIFAYRGIGFYAGGGVGAAYVDLDFDAVGLGTVDADEWVVAGQLGAGVTYDFNERVSLDLGYRFKATGDFEAVDDAGTTADDGNLYTHNIQMGLAVKF